MTPFADWVRKIFDHPVSEPEWYWDDGADISEPAATECVDFLTSLFESPEILAPYSEAQIDQGFWYLVSNASSNYMYSLIEPGVAWPLRQRGIRAIGILFERLFAPRCTQHLSHLGEDGVGPLNGICYMWWDIFPTWGDPRKPERADLDAELLAVMKRILGLDSIACQESAIHGLGHWQMDYPDYVRNAIDEFLTKQVDIRPELLKYARSARHGHVL